MLRKTKRLCLKLFAWILHVLGTLYFINGLLFGFILIAAGRPGSGFLYLLISFSLGFLCRSCSSVLKRGINAPTMCLLVLLFPFLPFIWFYHLCNRKHKSLEGRFKENWIDRCCVLRRPGSRTKRPNVIKENLKPDEGFSWYLHSYLACFLQWGCCILKFTEGMSLVDAVRRYEERPQIKWEDLLKQLKNNPYLAVLVEYMNMVLPKFYFRILPSGSIREGFGYPLPSTSILGSDYDLMFVPDGIYVYDETSEREGKFPASFTAIDDPNQNPERKTGYLWLKLEAENDSETWKNLSYERMTIDGSNVTLSFVH